MVKEKVYQVVVALPAKIRYQQNVLPYLFEHFSLERAIEIDGNILQTAGTLSKKPGRGRKEKYLEGFSKEFKFVIHKETNHFEIKIIYYIAESEQKVYITDFFPTKMNPQKISKNI